jgi:hypothetical protein
VGIVGRRALCPGRRGDVARRDRCRGRVRVDRALRDAAHSREWAEYLALGIRDVLHAGDQGAFDDDGFWEDNSAFYYPWQFDLADIQAPVSLWHGLKDFIPITHARWLADRIPNITTHFPPEEDHTNIEENNRAAAFAWLKVSV